MADKNRRYGTPEKDITDPNQSFIVELAPHDNNSAFTEDSVANLLKSLNIDTQNQTKGNSRTR